MGKWDTPDSILFEYARAVARQGSTTIEYPLCVAAEGLERYPERRGLVQTLMTRAANGWNDALEGQAGWRVERIEFYLVGDRTPENCPLLHDGLRVYRVIGGNTADARNNADERDFRIDIELEEFLTQDEETLYGLLFREYGHQLGVAETGNDQNQPVSVMNQGALNLSGNDSVALRHVWYKIRTDSTEECPAGYTESEEDTDPLRPGQRFCHKRAANRQCTDDVSRDCTYWALRGDCSSYTEHMSIHCCASCSRYVDCIDTQEHCAEWAEAEENLCTTNPEFMQTFCCASCLDDLVANTAHPGIGRSGQCTDDDQDNDGTPDCRDGCEWNPDKTEPGDCSCDTADEDTDNDNESDCLSLVEPGIDPMCCQETLQCVQDTMELTRDTLCVFLEPAVPTISCIVTAILEGDLEGLLVCLPLAMQTLPAQLGVILTEGTILDNLLELGGLILPCAFSQFNCMLEAVTSILGGDYLDQLLDAATFIGEQLIGLVWGVVSCAINGNDDDNWSLVFSDEFDGTGTPDPEKWESLEYNRKNNDSGPDGYWDRDDVYLDGSGNLVIRVRKIANQNGDGDPYDYSTGMVRSRGFFEQRYGKFEISCKLPNQPGWWAAFWLMSDSVGNVDGSGRDGTEIDIVESFGWTDKINQGLHYDGYGAEHQEESNPEYIDGIHDGYHTFTLEWSESEYVFFVDGRQTWRTNFGGVSQVPAHLMISGEISTVHPYNSSDWANDPETAHYPDYFVCDWVRVYERIYNW